MSRLLVPTREVTRVIDDAMNHALWAYRKGAVSHEPQVTDRLLGGVSEALRSFESKGIRWEAKTLTSQGRGAQEKKFGADFAGVLTLDLRDYVVRKGFLAQAKIIQPGTRALVSKIPDLLVQCTRMLDHTPDAFVFVYDTERIRVIPAISVVSSPNLGIKSLKSHSVRQFYTNHIGSFIGDRNIYDTTDEMLTALSKRFEVSKVLHLEGKQA